METSKNIKYYNELDDEGQFDWPGKYSRHSPKRKPGRVPVAIQKFVQQQDDSRKIFAFT